MRILVNNAIMGLLYLMNNVFHQLIMKIILNYFTPDNGTNYYTCESKMSNCELCTYNSYSFNKFHCTKCTNGFGLSKPFECAKESDLDSSEKFIKDFNNIFIFVIIYFILI